MSPPSRLPESVRSLFAAFEFSPDPVFVTDRHNVIVCWNRSAERILGHSPEEALGLPCAGFLQGSDLWGNRYCTDCCPVSQMGARGDVIRRFELSLRARDGRIVPAEVSILVLAEESGDRWYLAHILKPSERSVPVASEPRTENAPPRSPLANVRDSPDARARRLTEREVEVLGMLAAGRGTPDIAARLHISLLTARNHIQNILEKLEVHSKAEAVAFAFQKNLL